MPIDLLLIVNINSMLDTRFKPNCMVRPRAGSFRYGDFVGGYGRCKQVLRRTGGHAGTD